MLRTVPPFVTAHTFCAFWDIRVSLKNLPTNTTIFLRGLRLCGKSKFWQGLSKSKKKTGVTTHFSEIIELKFEKKLPYIFGILTLF